MEEVSWEDEFSGATPRERLCAIAFLVELLWPLVETGAHDDETELPVDAARVVLDSIWDVAAGRSQKVAGLPALSMPVMMIGTSPATPAGPARLVSSTPKREESYPRDGAVLDSR